MRRMFGGMMLGALLLTGCGVPSVPVTGLASAPPSVAATVTATTEPTATIVPTEAATATALPTATPAPTATIAPTATPAPTALPSSAAENTITVTEPAAGAAINSPMTIKGTTNFWPFEATLVVQVKDATGNVIGVGPAMVNSPEIGKGGPFEAQITFEAPAQAQDGTIEIFEASAKDGSQLYMQKLAVRLGGQ